MTRTKVRRGGLFGVLALAIGVVFAAGTPAAASAQSGMPDRRGAMADDTLTVTIERAAELARRANPAFRRANNALDQNGAERRATWMGSVLPQVSLDLFESGYRGNLSFQARDPFGNPIANPEADWSYFSSTNQGLTLNWSIQGLSIKNALREQRLTEQGREAAVETADWTLLGDVRTAYYDALEQRALLDVEEELATGRVVDLESARRRFGLAQASRVDVLNAEVQVEQQEIQVRQARAAYELALLSLRSTIGDPDAPPLRVEAVDLPIFDPAVLDAEVLIERARRLNPALREAELGVQEARAGLDRVGERWWPNLFVQYNLGRYSQAQEFASFADLSHERTDLQSSFYVGVSFPLLSNWFQDEASAAQARVQVANQVETRKERRLQIEASVRTELINLRNQHESLRLAERAADIAAEASELARGEYRIGTRTFEELQQTLEQESDARRTVIQARFGFVDALLALETAVGASVRPAGLD